MSYIVSFFFQLFKAMRTYKIITFIFLITASLCHGKIIQTINISADEDEGDTPDVITVTLKSDTFKKDIKKKGGKIRVPINDKKPYPFASLDVLKYGKKPTVISKPYYSNVKVEYQLKKNPRIVLISANNIAHTPLTAMSFKSGPSLSSRVHILDEADNWDDINQVKITITIRFSKAEKVKREKLMKESNIRDFIKILNKVGSINELDNFIKEEKEEEEGEGEGEGDI